MSPETEELRDRMRDLIGHRPGVVEKRMFGGVCFMLNGNMVGCAMSSGDILLRADPGRLAETMALPGVSPMMMGEREMTGFYTVAFDEIADEDGLSGWVERAFSYVRTMPPKPDKSASRRSGKP
jgi:TfoX/Sxy family transcriptional regulator of competence genes